MNTEELNEFKIIQHKRSEKLREKFELAVSDETKAKIRAYSSKVDFPEMVREFLERAIKKIEQDLA